MHQSAYAKRVIENFDMSNAKSVVIPSDPHLVLHPEVNGEIKSEKASYTLVARL